LIETATDGRATAIAAVEIEVFGVTIRLPRLRRYEKFYAKLRAGKWEARTFQILGENLDSRTNYVDIGAWIGVTAFWASHFAKSVVAVEPDPECIKILRQFAPEYPKLTVLEGALATDPTLLLHAHGDFGSSETSALGGEQGPSVTAKGYLVEEIMEKAGPGPVFVKIDIEGYEYAIAGEIAKLATYDLRGLQCAVHPQLYERSLSGPLLLRRIRTVMATYRLGKMLPRFGVVPGQRYSGFLSFLAFGVLFCHTPRGTDLVYYRQG
jgi:FkbM family methyltransferase